MKKLILILTLSLIVSVVTNAKNIDVATATIVAKNFYIEKAVTSVNKPEIILTLAFTCVYKNADDLASASNENIYYIFNINTNDGFVIVSADDIVSPVIGYANKGTYTGKNLPPDFIYWMDGYKRQIIFAKANKIGATDEIRAKWDELLNNNAKSIPLTLGTSVSPLVQTLWDQSPYYNDSCPGGSVTGCVATAMAQVMKYWNFPPHGRASHAYTDQTYGGQFVNFGTTSYNWFAMPQSVSSGNSSVATLMYDCGVSVDMSYSPSGSGAYVTSAASPIQNCAEYAYKTYFNYNPATVQGILYSNYAYPYTQIKTLMKNDLDNNRPVDYGGVDLNNGGHSWVCDGYDVNDYFHMNWGWSGQYNSYFDIIALNPATFAFDTMQEIIIGIIPDTANAPAADFIAISTTSSCSGNIRFNDLSWHLPTSWKWSFGDGTTDTTANPSHTYTTNGTYTVKLVVKNRNGADSLQKTNYITINLPVAPTVTNAMVCDSGSVTLSASGSGILEWFSSQTGSTIIGTGASYITPILNSTTNYYVSNEITSSPVYGAKPNNSGGGGYLSNASQWLIFDCYTPLTLISVDVYAQSTGVRTIELRDNSGNVLQSYAANITATGLSTITLNFSVPVGTNLVLGLNASSTADLYRNNAGVSYPYTTTGLFSVTTSSADTAHYYYFYNWQVQVPACSSSRMPVTAQVLQIPVAGFSATTNGGNVTFTNTSLNATSYLWNFGDGDTSTSANPIHTYSTNDVDTVMLIAVNNCGQDTTFRVFHIVATGIGQLSSGNAFDIFPNPGDGIFNIRFSPGKSDKSLINIFNIQGKKVYSNEITSGTGVTSKSIDLSNYEKGIYFIELISGSVKKNSIIILQ